MFFKLLYKSIVCNYKLQCVIPLREEIDSLKNNGASTSKRGINVKNEGKT